MTLRNALTLVLLLGGLPTALGCGGDDKSKGGGASIAGSGAGGTGGSAGDTGGGDATCVNEGEDNVMCPENPPLTGSCAPKGECCHRASNKAKEAMLGPDEPGELEYRINFSLTRNHPLTIGADILVQAGIVRSDNEEQSLLWRFKGPRMGGVSVAGPGESTIGVGRYNCDGTYSFYDDTTAPPKPGISEDATRWRARTIPTQVDPTKDGRERNHIAFADNVNRELVYTPFVNTDTFALEWELVNQGFDIREIDTGETGRDCIGKRDAASWTPGGTFVTYTPIEPNDSELITAAGGITYCQLVAFGVFATNSCKDTPRCMPDTMCAPACDAASPAAAMPDENKACKAKCCPWRKIPDTLCPVTADDKTKWGCHLGAVGNVNMETDYPSDAEINCTMEAPTGVLDPDVGPMVSKGQCCDPLGQSTTLPACNAFRLIQDYVAAAAEITDETKNQLQQKCE